jgi:hypothetical protein
MESLRDCKYDSLMNAMGDKRQMKKEQKVKKWMEKREHKIKNEEKRKKEKNRQWQLGTLKQCMLCVYKAMMNVCETCH